MKHQKIFKIYLRTTPRYLLPPKGERDKPSIDKDTAVIWWEKSSPEFISKVKKVKNKDLKVEAIGYIINKKDDIVFLSPSVVTPFERFQHVKVISRDNISKIEELKISPDKKAQVGDPVMLEWEDPILSFDTGTMEELKGKCKIPLTFRLGFLISNSDKGIYTSSLSGKRKYYLENMVNPRKSIKVIHSLI